MEQAKGTWRSLLGKPFISAEDFNVGDKVTLTIEAVGKTMARDAMSGKEKELPALAFVGSDRLMALNVTNSRIIGEAYGVKVNQWVGQKVTLVRATTKFGRQTKPCVRIEIPK